MIVMKNIALSLVLCATTGLNGAGANEAIELRRKDLLHKDDGVEQMKSDISGLAQKGLDSLEWGLLIEAEGSYAESGGGNDSDLTLATVEFVLDAAVNDWIHGHLGLLWEEDDTESDNLDEAYIEIGGSKDYPYYFVAGRFYLPFGNFESAFISDPLTLELAEIRQSSAMAGIGNEWIELNAGAFKGDVDKDEEEDDNISDFYASVTYTPSEYFQCGAYWLSDLMETDSQSDFGDDVAQLDGYDKQGGAGAFANVFIGPFMFNAEYASALDSYDVAGGSYLPMAFNLEASMQFAEKWRTGLTFQGSDDLYAAHEDDVFGDKYPGRAYGAVVSYGLHENVTVSAEYLHLEDLDDGEDGDLVTLQLALEI
ncbi:LbtU family siderophore porin [Pontiella sulfatireligans]|uniref:Porin domain-containing protein n=1 Tax=Pontiella sulfatireligans TaxID=2750658 RepID=A0A6C2UPA5_9BACT|nr:LbtU family siderophore porin [Pontiella sulfatireligans]VGO21773.1 hypothetical protein SCARR_03850 [Pontiella sulfatireligans]